MVWFCFLAFCVPQAFHARNLVRCVDSDGLFMGASVHGTCPDCVKVYTSLDLALADPLLCPGMGRGSTRVHEASEDPVTCERD